MVTSARQALFDISISKFQPLFTLSTLAVDLNVYDVLSVQLVYFNKHPKPIFQAQQASV
jgi:hypothetical protein